MIQQSRTIEERTKPRNLVCLPLLVDSARCSPVDTKLRGFLFAMQITFDLALFREAPARVGDAPGGLARKESEKALLWLLESLVNINREELRKNRFPPLYRANVRYQREERTEIWKDVSRIFRDGYGDCEDLACWRVAELRNNGKKATPYIRYRFINGRYVYHVLVLRPNGLEDPSRILGMI